MEETQRRFWSGLCLSKPPHVGPCRHNRGFARWCYPGDLDKEKELTGTVWAVLANGVFPRPSAWRSNSMTGWWLLEGLQNKRTSTHTVVTAAVTVAVELPFPLQWGNYYEISEKHHCPECSYLAEIKKVPRNRVCNITASPVAPLREPCCADSPPVHPSILWQSNKQ